MVKSLFSTACMCSHMSDEPADVSLQQEQSSQYGPLSCTLVQTLATHCIECKCHAAYRALPYLLVMRR